eukprot:1506183-Pleurochrysis_carterae.AAC.1
MLDRAESVSRLRVSYVRYRAWPPLAPALLCAARVNDGGRPSVPAAAPAAGRPRVPPPAPP